MALWIVPAVLLAGCLALLTAVQVCAARRRVARKSDCLIVLGAKVHADGRLSTTLKDRCARAADAYHNGVAPAVIVCGGQGSDEPCTEADAMREELIRRGVPETAVLTEPDSVDTRQNLENAKRLMAANGWKTCAIVTSDYHVQRTLWIARDLGMTACGISAPTGDTFKRFMKTRLRESVSWVRYRLNKN